MFRTRNFDVVANRNPDHRRKGVVHQSKSGETKMSMTSGAGIVVATLLLGSASIVHAMENDARGTKSGLGGINYADNAATVVPAPRQAPVGHRQPRTSDIPATTLSPLDLELRREDQMIDRK